MPLTNYQAQHHHTLPANSITKSLRPQHMHMQRLFMSRPPSLRPICCVPAYSSCLCRRLDMNMHCRNMQVRDLPPPSTAPPQTPRTQHHRVSLLIVRQQKLSKFYSKASAQHSTRTCTRNACSCPGPLSLRPICCVAADTPWLRGITTGCEHAACHSCNMQVRGMPLTNHQAQHHHTLPANSITKSASSPTEKLHRLGTDKTSAHAHARATHVPVQTPRH
jgi:hypothetical protein